jgi:hypothetical protein
MKGVEALFMEVNGAGELILTRSSGYERYEISNDTENR